MSKYSVSVIFDACKCVDVESESPEQAADMAYDEAGYVGLCHQCSGEVEMGGAVRAIVYDESGDEVADDGYQAMEIEKITQQRDELLAALEWSDHQIMEFISIAFRHAEIKGDFKLSDVRDALNMVKSNAIAKAKGV